MQGWTNGRGVKKYSCWNKKWEGAGPKPCLLYVVLQIYTSTVQCCTILLAVRLHHSKQRTRQVL